MVAWLSIRGLRFTTLVVVAGVSAAAALSSDGASAAAEGYPSPDLSIEIDVNGDTIPDCDTRGSPPEGTCAVRAGRVFTVEVYLNTVDGLGDSDGDGEYGYTGFRIMLAHPETLTFQDRLDLLWPDFAPPGVCGGSDGIDGFANVLAFTGLCYVEWYSGIESTYVGKLMEADFACSDPGDAITMFHFPTYLIDDTGKHGLAVDRNDKGAPEVLAIDCVFPWDVNGDGTVSVSDIGLVVSHFGRTVPPAPPEADVDGNGGVSIGDIGLVVQHFGEPVPD